jgi:hypothetical protein
MAFNYGVLNAPREGSSYSGHVRAEGAARLRVVPSYVTYYTTVAGGPN